MLNKIETAVRRIDFSLRSYTATGADPEPILYSYIVSHDTPGESSADRVGGSLLTRVNDPADPLPSQASPPVLQGIYEVGHSSAVIEPDRLIPDGQGQSLTGHPIVASTGDESYLVIKIMGTLTTSRAITGLPRPGMTVPAGI